MRDGAGGGGGDAPDVEGDESDGDGGGGIGEEGDGGGGDGDEGDFLVGMLRAARRRETARAAALARAEAEADRLMDMGVRINPGLRAMVEKRRAGRVAVCAQGHVMALCDAGAAGLTCDGGCGGPIKRGSSWWCCEECDYDVCMVCESRPV